MSKIIMPTDGKWYEPLTRTVPQATRNIDGNVYDYQPGNGTKYIVSLLPLGTAREEMGARYDAEFMMVVHNMGTQRAVYVGPNTQYYDLNEKLGLGTADCLALCCFIRYYCGDLENLTFPGGVTATASA